MEINEDNPINKILSLSFNKTNTCLACGTETGFIIYRVDPFEKIIERDLDGGIGCIEQLNNTNIIVLVGGGKHPKFPPNKVIVWDEDKGKSICEIRVNFFVQSVKINKEKIFIICEDKIFVHNTKDFQIHEVLETLNNPKGIVAISNNPDNSIIAFPDKIKGNIKLKSYTNDKNISFNVCESSIACVEFNSEGTLIATSSETGTLLRLFQTSNGALLHELRRGSEKADITHLSFHDNSFYVSCTSDHGTIHLFSLKTVRDKIKAISQKKSIDVPLADNSTSLYGSFVPSFFGGNKLSIEYSFAQLRINDSKSYCIFSPTGTNVFVATLDCNFYNASYDIRNGGDCKILKKEKIVI